MNKLIMIGGAVGLLLASVGGTLFLTGAFSKGAAAPSAAAARPEPNLDTHYHNFHPEFVVNLEGAKRSGAKFLMIELSAATQDEKVIDVFDTHRPEIRNNLLALLGAQDSETLNSTEGKEALRQKARDVIDAVVTRHYTAGLIDDVYFTRFVMQ